MYGALDISTSGLVAQRVRFDTISANVANANTLLNADGEYEPFRRRIPILSAGDPTTGDPVGVHVTIELDESPLRPKLEPHSKHADESGFVYYPNIDPVIEKMNSMEALRAYEANITAVEATKSLMSVALELLA